MAADETRTKKPTDREINSGIKKAKALDSVAKRILQSVDPTYSDRRLLDLEDAEFQRIIDRQLDIAKGVSNNQVVDFLATIRKEHKVGRPSSKRNNSIEATDLFTENIGDVFGYFQDVSRNRFMEVADLKFISKFIPSIGEAIRIYLDAIISSDDVSQIITRKIDFPGTVKGANKTSIMQYIEKMEEEYKLLQKLKVAYKKTLVSGTFYVYHIAYRDLFAMYSQGVASGRITKDGASLLQGNANAMPEDPNPGQLQNGPNGKMPKPGKHNPLGIAQENAIYISGYEEEPSLENFGKQAIALANNGFITKLNMDSSAIEQAIDDAAQLTYQYSGNIPRGKDGEQQNAEAYAKSLRASIEADMPNIYFNSSPIPYDIQDDASFLMATEGYHEYFNLRKDIDDSIDKMTKSEGGFDGTMDMLHPSKSRAQNFAGVTGTYLKWIDYKYIIPIEILGRTMGYYHIITTSKSRKAKTKSNAKPSEIGGILSSSSMSMFDQLNVADKRKEDALQNIVDTISNAILDQFSAKFVKKNSAFKQIIAECIIANGLVDNDYMIQFIPVDNIIEFKCNEDETGKGESILSDAMFPAHLLLSFTVSKMLNFINKGGNKTVAHVSSGRVNRSLGNQVNRVLRDLQAGNVTATDLLSSSAVFSKVTRDQNIAMPKDQQGNKLVEFEIQEGQQMEMDTQYEEMLQKWCMIATGMPPTIMDYESNVDIAKKVVSDNIRVAGRVASLQSDFEKPTSELYRCLLEDSDLEDNLKSQVVGTLNFKLPRPRILANQNDSEALNTAYQNAQTIVNVLLGENGGMDEEQDEIKRILTRKIVEDSVPYVDWDKMDELHNAAIVQFKKEKHAKISQGENPDEQGGGMDMGSGGMDMGMGGGDDMGMGDDTGEGGGDEAGIGGMDELGF